MRTVTSETVKRTGTAEKRGTDDEKQRAMPR